MAEAYQHLTYEQRCQIYVLLKSGTTQKSIADIIGATQPTISREINRNSGKRGYRFRQAHKNAIQRRHKAQAGAQKLTAEVIEYIKYLLTQKQWSPEQISGRMKMLYGSKAVSHEIIYQHIWQDKLAGGTLYKHLRCQGKKYNKRGSKNSGRGFIPGRIGIEQRPDIVNSKQRIGDLEVDTIVGAGRKGCILSVVDRKSKLTILSLLSSRTANEVSSALIASVSPIKDALHTITSDNGKEFAQHQHIKSKLKTDFFFARPYHAWERGLNENTNRLVRQYFPKKKSIDKLTPWEVKQVEYLLNMRPRKTLNYRTPLEVFFDATGINLNYALRS